MVDPAGRHGNLSLSNAFALLNGEANSSPSPIKPQSSSDPRQRLGSQASSRGQSNAKGGRIQRGAIEAAADAFGGVASHLNTSSAPVQITQARPVHQEPSSLGRAMHAGAAVNSRQPESSNHANDEQLQIHRRYILQASAGSTRDSQIAKSQHEDGDQLPEAGDSLPGLLQQATGFAGSAAQQADAGNVSSAASGDYVAGSQATGTTLQDWQEHTEHGSEPIQPQQPAQPPQSNQQQQQHDWEGFSPGTLRQAGDRSLLVHWQQYDCMQPTLQQADAEEHQHGFGFGGAFPDPASLMTAPAQAWIPGAADSRKFLQPGGHDADHDSGSRPGAPDPAELSPFATSGQLPIHTQPSMSSELILSMLPQPPAGFSGPQASSKLRCGDVEAADLSTPAKPASSASSSSTVFACGPAMTGASVLHFLGASSGPMASGDMLFGMLPQPSRAHPAEHGVGFSAPDVQASSRQQLAVLEKQKASAPQQASEALSQQQQQQQQ